MPSPLRGLHEAVRPLADWALGWARYYNVPVTVTSSYRSWQSQADLRRRWERAGRPASCIRTPTGLVCPANRPGDSAHNYGLAWDSTTEPRYQAWWNHVRTLAGFSVPPHDEVHAEVPNWRSYVTVTRSPR